MNPLEKPEVDGSATSQIVDAPIDMPEPTPFGMTKAQAVVAELAKLPLLEYDTRREEAAKDLGIRVSTLDAEVAKARPVDVENPDDAHADVVESLEPWSDPVDGAELADAIQATLSRHVTFADQADPIAATLWVFGTYLMDVWRLWPKVLISSPAKRCGKSTLCEVFEAQVHRPLIVANCTAAALFRTIEAFKPTFVLDEADTFLRENPELTGILNAGHTRRTAFVVRLIGDNHEPKKFSVWCPQIIAGIGEQTDTLADRSIRIDLKRQLPNERKARLPADLFEQSTDTRRKLLRWADDNAMQTRASEADLGECGNDRARDNWEPLARLASILGGPWPDRVRTAYAVKEGQNDDTGGDDAALMLLTDLHGWFGDHPAAQHVTSADLVDHLIGVPDRPWGTWAKGTFPITPRAVALKLKAFDVRPRVARTRSGTARAYAKADVVDAFTRYVLPSLPNTGATSVTAEQIHENNGLEGVSSVTSGVCVTLENNSNTLKYNECYGVTVENTPKAPLSGEGSENDLSKGGF